MRLLPRLALFVALTTMFLPSALAAPAQQADARSILDRSAQAMDAAQSMRFAGSMDMTVSVADSPISISMPMSGAYQAPDRMTMNVQVPDMSTSMDMVMVGGQVWMRSGAGLWKASPAGDAYASPLGMNHQDWVNGLTDVAATDLGNTYRASGTMDISDALKAGYSGAGLSGRTRTAVDFSGSTAQIVLTIDKATNYMVAMQMDLAMPLPDFSAAMSMTMNMSFTDFNGVAEEIRAPA